ncbi:hypothetical protein TKWG_22455 [Advenella kashmirensis WT001]|uniref:Uncharacterized protein n=1 Tax=Advenella kashmirensis (strain DSM 17095 / LMG 22695 / WT001) TaxID=1036672 RepID=I3UGJ5_ADVKW|nr:hypothetical protein TKWG_22455 [Advenella kashmirensis WT001]
MQSASGLLQALHLAATQAPAKANDSAHIATRKQQGRAPTALLFAVFSHLMAQRQTARALAQARD